MDGMREEWEEDGKAFGLKLLERFPFLFPCI